MAKEIFMPKLSSTMAEGTIIEWFKEEGDDIEVGEPILEIMTDKINIEVESYDDGILLKRYFETDDVVPVNQVIGFIGEEGESIPEESPGISEEAKGENETENESSEQPNTENELPEQTTKQQVDFKKNDNITSQEREPMIGKIRATPAARAFARNKQINIKEVEGTGRNGRIHKEDVVSHLSKQTFNEPKVGEIENEVTQPYPPTAKSTAEKLKGSRKVTAERMVDSSNTIPHVTIDFEVVMDNLIELRSELNKNYNGVKISFNDLFILIVSKALELHKDINITFENNEITYHDERNIALAVAVEKELFVPVVKNTENMGLFKISQENRRLIEKTRNRELSQHDMMEGTFTITNLGMFNIKNFTPIINKPQGAILGIGSTNDQPSLKNGNLYNKKVVILSLSFDHRVINGAPAASFCNTIKKLAENPIELIL